MCSEIIVMLNLCSVLITLQAKGFNEFITQLLPVFFGKSNLVRIKITGGATKFCCKRNFSDKLHLVFDALNKYHYFFAKFGWRCRLTVRMGKHGNIFPF